MLNTKHAKYSPSKLPRIIRCPGSTIGEENAIDTQSEYALHGEVLHKITELHLQNRTYEINSSYVTQALEKFDNYDKVEKEDLDAVQEVLDWVVSLYLKHADAEIVIPLVEVKVSLEEYTNLMNCDNLRYVYGTLDFLIRFDDILYVIDWKYGKGVEVYPDSAQLLTYATGALQVLDLSSSHFSGLKEINLVIGQPRLYSGEHFKVHQVSHDDLFRFLQDQLVPALNDLSTITPSEKACMWCHKKLTCDERNAMRSQIASEVFAVHAEIKKKSVTPERVSEVLEDMDFLKSCIKDIEDYAYKTIKAGNRMPGWKLVPGRSIRKWKNEKEAKLYYFTQSDLNPNDLVTTKFKSPTGVEKLIGKRNMTQLDHDLVVKPEGKPTLVRETDKRNAIEYQTAEEKFKTYT